MKPKTTLLSAIWLISFALACVIGAKVNSSKLEKTATENSTEVSSSLGSKSTHAQRKSSARRNISSGKQDPQAEFTSIIEIQDSAERTTRLLALIKTLGPEGLQQVATAFYTSGLAYQRLTEYSMVINAWVKADPLGILDQIAKYQHLAITPREILAIWAEVNPKAALDWAENNKEVYGDRLFLGVIQGIAVHDPHHATELVTSLGKNLTDLSIQRSFQIIGPQIARLGQDKAAKWLNGITDETAHYFASLYLTTPLTRQDPAAAATWANSIESDSSREIVIATLAREWALKDIPSVIAWTATLSDNDKVTAAKALIANYTHENPEEASQWLNNFIGSYQYDSIVHDFIDAAAINHPELALAKASTLRESFRHNYYETVIAKWYKKDAPAAEEWMLTNNIPEEIRQTAIKYSQR